MSNWILALVLCLSISRNYICEGASPSEKSVFASLEVNWKHSSFIAETSEFVAQHFPSVLWTFIESVKPVINDEDNHNESGYEAAINLASTLLPESVINLLRLALSLHLYAPKIQSFQQIASEYVESKSCFIFADINGQITCDEKELERLIQTASERPKSSVYSIDHNYTRAEKDSQIIAILYGNIENENFAKFHSALKSKSDQGAIIYTFRHFYKESDSNAKIGLSGYGIELAIKSTEYKAIDDSNAHKYDDEKTDLLQDLHGFNFTILREKHTHLKEELRQFRIHLSELDELAPLKQWEVSEISLQAAQKIMLSQPEEALTQLADISQNFPIRARSLVQTKVQTALREEIEANQQRFSSDLDIAEGVSGFFLNGISIDIDTLDIFQLFQTLTQEEILANAFYQMGIKREYQSLLFDTELGEEKVSGYAIDYRDAHPEFLNNLDKDKTYRDWGNSVKMLLQPYFPGMLRPIARNLFTVVCIIDPASPDAFPLIKIAYSLFNHQVPIRIGFVFVVNNDKTTVSGMNDLGVALLNLYNFAKSDKNVPKAISMLLKLYGQHSSELNVGDVHNFFKKQYTDQTIDDVFGLDSDYDAGRANGQEFLKRSGIRQLPSILVNGIQLEQANIRPDNVEDAILIQVMRLTNQLQHAVMGGKLIDSENVANWVMDQPNVLPRLNQRLIAPASNVLPLFDINPCRAKVPSEFEQLLPSEQRTQCILEQIKYVTKGEAYEETKWFNVWLVADLNSPSGREFLENGMKALKKSDQLRLGFMHNGQKKIKTNTPSFSQLINALVEKLANTLAKQALNKALSMDEQGITDLLQTLALEKLITGQGVDLAALKREIVSQEIANRLELQQQFSQRDLGLKPGQRAVIVNGMVYGPLDDEEELNVDDFLLLEKLFEKRGAKAVAGRVSEWLGSKGAKSSDMTIRAYSVLSKYAVKKKRQNVVFESDLESVLHLIAEDDSHAVINFVGILDPLSEQAQKLAPILQTLLNVVNSDLHLAMNPRTRLSELPLKRFYRYVLTDTPLFDATGKLALRTTSFDELPAQQLLTLSLMVPDAWMIQPVYANHDMDNIKISAANSDIVARYELTQILLEGHCFDDESGNPPRGLQFVLGTKTQPSRYDTIVMANLGYFQLKAAPGVWTLQLREGKSRNIYKLQSCPEAEIGSVTDDELNVVVDGFAGKIIYVRVLKRPGMESMNLLTGDADSNSNPNLIDDSEDDENGPSIWSSLSNKLMGGESYDKINIFSLASGHLYERFMRIMMLSVMKHTKHPVKFWLLNNYLSPNFRETLPVLANHYGFDYELIEYRWPRWLHHQTNKQRLMWGYKILFLDVLFPLDVKKIIFVDADQIVRTDLMELMTLDLNGAPYGYTPFCESRTSMDGFRFWKTGYWANHLGNRKYHISALYVVDLIKFRQLAAGDRLRGQYQGLSSDPNSLANLDQDLPNNMIHMVRIHSLPQEWLWCETWCDDASKEKAKTIDLCNNPQTKEPKLDSAIRIVPEWSEYDAEIRRLLQQQTNESVSTTATDQRELPVADEQTPKAEVKHEAPRDEF